MPCFWTLIFLCFALYANQLSEAERHHRPNKLPSSSAAVIVGTVYCDTCFHRDLPKTESNHFIAGATVAVECGSSGSRMLVFRQEVKTNSRGEFRVQLPFTVGKRVKRIRGCSIALIRSSQPSCAAAAAAPSSSLRLRSRSGGERVFSAGFFTFKPQVCDQKKSSASHNRKPYPKMAFILPPNPLNPPVLPPNPLLPPPSLLPPVLPTPPPSVLPPVLPTPPSSPTPFFPLPPIPGMTPSPPPTPPSSLPIPLPPVPSLPIPPVPSLPIPPVPSLPIPPVPSLPIPPVPSLPIPPVPSLPIPPVPSLPIPPVPSLPLPPVPSLPLPPVPSLPLPPLIPGGPPHMRTSHP